jgi:hypothetical protein
MFGRKEMSDKEINGFFLLGMTPLLSHTIIPSSMIQRSPFGRKVFGTIYEWIYQHLALVPSMDKGPEVDVISEEGGIEEGNED